MTHTILAVFKDRKNAEDAINDLSESGYNPKDISIIMKDKEEASKLSDNTGTNVAEGVVSGATTGAIVGGLAGLLAAIAIPGLGAFLIGGPIAAALGLGGAAASTVSGAATGALAGGLVGALTGLGLSDDDAKRYESAVKEGGILVAVPVSQNRAQEVEELFEDYDATDIETVAHKEGNTSMSYQGHGHKDDTTRRLRGRKSSSQGKLVGPVELQKYLDGVDYPVSRQDLIASAKESNANSDVLFTLKQLPDEEFSSANDVSKSVGKIE